MSTKCTVGSRHTINLQKVSKIITPNKHLSEKTKIFLIVTGFSLVLRPFHVGHQRTMVVLVFEPFQPFDEPPTTRQTGKNDDRDNDGGQNQRYGPGPIVRIPKFSVLKLISSS